MVFILGGHYPVADASGAGFISFRSVGTRYNSPQDGVGPFALSKPAGIVSGDLLVVSQMGTGFSLTHPTENPGKWTMFANTSEQKIAWRVATADSNDDYTLDTVGSTTAHTAVMFAFDLSAGPYATIAVVAGGTLLGNDSSYGTAFPTPGFATYSNSQTLTIAQYFKSTNISLTATGLTDNLDAVAAALSSTTASGNIDTTWFDGLAGNPSGARTSWAGVNYWITDGNPANALSFPPADQTEAPQSSGFEVVTIYGIRFRITT